MKPYKRTDRVASLIQQALASIFLRHSIEFNTENVAITYVTVSRDLSYAKVFVTIINLDSRLRGNDVATQIIKTLNKRSPYIQHLLAKNIKLRITPKLQFFYDESVIRGNEISRLIDEAVVADKKLHNKEQDE